MLCGLNIIAIETRPRGPVRVGGWLIGGTAGHGSDGSLVSLGVRSCRERYTGCSLTYIPMFTLDEGNVQGETSMDQQEIGMKRNLRKKQLSRLWS